MRIATDTALRPPDPPVTDATLVERARDGDERAFEQLYRGHIARVIALCARLSGSRVRGEELAHDVFVRVWRRLAQYRGEAAFTSWLHRLTVNFVLNESRADRRREARVTTRERIDLVGAASAGGVPGEDIDLERAIATLPPGARGVFVLHDVEGYTHEEIAEIMGIATGTSKAHLCRARRLLRKALER